MPPRTPTPRRRAWRATGRSPRPGARSKRCATTPCRPRRAARTPAGWRRGASLAARAAGFAGKIERPFALDAIRGYERARRVGGKPRGECLGLAFVHRTARGRPEPGNAVFVLQPGIAVDEDREREAPRKLLESRAIDEVGGGELGRTRDCLAGPLPRLEVARPGLAPPGGVPELQLFLVRARIVGARNELRARFANARKRLRGIALAAHARRIGSRSSDDEVVPHHVGARSADAARHQLLFVATAVREYDVDVAVLGVFHHLAGARDERSDLDAARGRKGRQEDRENAGILERVRGAQAQHGRLTRRA